MLLCAQIGGGARLRDVGTRRSRLPDECSELRRQRQRLLQAALALDVGACGGRSRGTGQVAQGPPRRGRRSDASTAASSGRGSARGGGACTGEAHGKACEKRHLQNRISIS